MNFKEYQEKRNALMAEVKEFLDKSNAKEADKKMEEVKELDNKWEEIKLAQANFNALNDDPKGLDITNLAGDKGVDGVVVDTLDKNAIATDIDIYDSVEYRKAFMNNVVKGTPIPEKFQNVDQNTTTSDVGSVIPTTVLEKIVEKLEATGMILPLVTRTSYKGGLAIPTSSVKPVATWVAEGAGSEKQKKTTGQIVFSYYK
ncbi:phage major capsid protein, partial [Clostridium sp.]|uniref:phage major capsid protein n=1 Tax=Clostridium sp. TaxID=1506 RepID=UPI00359FD4E5